MGGDKNCCGYEPSLQPILLFRASADNLNQSILIHLPCQQICSGFLHVQQFLQIIIIHLAILSQIIQYCLHLRCNNDRSRCVFRCSRTIRSCFRIHIGKNQLECVRRNFDPRLYSAVFIEIENFTDTGAVRFNQLQTMEDFCKIPVPRQRRYDNRFCQRISWRQSPPEAVSGRRQTESARFFEGDSVGAFECQKQKRGKIRGNRLGDESEIAGDLRFFVVLWFGHDPSSLIVELSVIPAGIPQSVPSGRSRRTNLRSRYRRKTPARPRT